jgi:hypothetical protein
MRSELRCRLFPGQFSSEFAVVVETFNGRFFSLFASRDEVMSDQEPTQDAPTDGWLSVQVIERRANNVLLRLPQSTVENGQYLAVRSDQIRNALETVENDSFQCRASTCSG